MLFSTVTSSALASVLTFGVVIAGRFSDVFRNMREVLPGVPAWVSEGLYALIPNFRNFDFKDRVTYGDPVPGDVLLWVTVIFMRKGAPPETTTTTTTAAPAPTTTTTTVAAPAVTTTTSPVPPTAPSTTPTTTAPRSASPEPTEASPSALPVAQSGEEAEDLLQGPLPSTSQALHLPIAD